MCEFICLQYIHIVYLSTGEALSSSNYLDHDKGVMDSNTWFVHCAGCVVNNDSYVWTRIWIPTFGNTQYSTCIKTYWFIPVISSVAVILLPHMMVIFKSQQYWVPLYAIIQVISRHDINPNLTNFARKSYREILLKFCVIRPLYRASTHKTFCIIWSEILRRLWKCYSKQNKGQSWYLANDHFLMVEIIGMRNEAFHEQIPGHQLNISWRNVVSDLCINGLILLGLDDGAFHNQMWISLRSEALSNAGAKTDGGVLLAAENMTQKIEGKWNVGQKHRIL